jgi:hypothetical protein
MNGAIYKHQIEDMWAVLFRPRWKHGYLNPRLNSLIDNCPEVNEAIDLLEELYREVTDVRGR